jgi:hypothetical protein
VARDVRIGLDEGGGPREVEQHLFCDLDAELIERIDLLCSGFRPVLPGPTGVHRFDAGTLGCADGLAGAFRLRIGQIPMGDSLVVVRSHVLYVNAPIEPNDGADSRSGPTQGSTAVRRGG